MNLPDLDTLLAHTTRGGPDGTCRLWNHGRATTGYGRVRLDGRSDLSNGWTYGTHRVAWALSAGVDPDDLPAAMHVRHTCDNRACCNPEHLRPGTHAANMRDTRGKHPTRCKRGHDMTDPHNVRESPGRRVCRACDALRSRRYYDKRRNGPTGDDGSDVTPPDVAPRRSTS